MNSSTAENVVSSSFTFPLLFPIITRTPAAEEKKRKMKARKNMAADTWPCACHSAATLDTEMGGWLTPAAITAARSTFKSMHRVPSQYLNNPMVNGGIKGLPE
jgi:hypothetical protein